jgi:glyoxylase-like metal-dependent hydrolase (beta-lactamase superfamily II)
MIGDDMKRAAAVLVFSLLLVAAFRHEGLSQPNLVHQLAPGVYYREPEPEKRIIANTSWIVFRDYVVVIDANYPWGARAVLNDLRQTSNLPIRFIFDTHYHADHAYGNSVWVDGGATIVCSEECTAESRAKNTPGWAKNAETGEYSLKPYRLEHPQISFRDKMVVDDGARRLELLRIGPAHTRGDSVAYLPKERILFTGDVVVNSTLHNLSDADADHDNWVRVLDDLAQKDITTVVPGHGAIGSVDTIRGDRAFLGDLINQVRAGIASGKTADQVAESVDVSQHKPWGTDSAKNKVFARAVYAKLAKK